MTIAAQRKLVAVRRQGAICRLTLQNPPANLLSLEAMACLVDELDTANKEAAIHVIILAAAGQLFSAGHDLKEMTRHRADADGGTAFFERTFACCARLILSIVDNSKPVIAEVDGIATAAGCQLVASCDLAIASDQARFGVNGIDVGLFCTTPAVALTRTISSKRAMEMLLTGDMIDAATALDYGLVNKVVPRGSLTDEVDRLAARIAAKSPEAIQLGKRGVHRQAGANLAEAYRLSTAVMVENMMTADAAEGISAFLDKRQPSWRAQNRH